MGRFWFQWSCAVIEPPDNREVSDEYYAVTENKSIVVSRWMDNSMLNVPSTIHSVFPLSNALRYSAAEKKKISIKRPQCIEKYMFMGGTDQMDANIKAYRIRVKVNKKVRGKNGGGSFSPG